MVGEIGEILGDRVLDGEMVEMLRKMGFRVETEV